MAAYVVTVQVRIEPGVDASAAAVALMEQLLEFGADDASLGRDDQNIEVTLPTEARTQADALAKAARLLARSLEGEPVQDLKATVTPATPTGT